MRPKLCPGTIETAESDARNATQEISKEYVIVSILLNISNRKEVGLVSV